MAYLIQAFLTLFVVIDPVGLSPIFISLAGDRPGPEQFSIARRAILIAGAILLVFAVVGTPLLHHLGISIEAFQVAAGVLLFKIAVEMVYVQRERETADEEKESRSREDISVFPLAIPLIAGPGTLATVLILASEAKDHPLGIAGVIGIAALVLIIAYIFLCLSNRLAAVLGRTGINVVTRVLGVLLAALAVQYIANGAGALLKAASL
jgi:multiple antibiotic resistance protein